jgi:hypothetical protein
MGFYVFQLRISRRAGIFQCFLNDEDGSVFILSVTHKPHAQHMCHSVHTHTHAHAHTFLCRKLAITFKHFMRFSVQGHILGLRYSMVFFTPTPSALQSNAGVIF